MIKSTGANTVHYLAEQMEKLGTALGELVLHFKLASTLKVLNELQLSNSNFALTCCLNVLWMNSAVGIKVCALLTLGFLLFLAPFTFSYPDIPKCPGTRH